MAKRSLTEWAAISEIIGTAAVVVSLLIVAFTVSQNTKVMRATNDNLMYQVQDSIIGTLATDPSLVSIYLKRAAGDTLTDVEYERMWNQGFRDLLMWELAFTRHKEGLFTPDQWYTWNRSYSKEFPSVYGDKFWAEARQWMRDDFAAHVDAAYVSYAAYLSGGGAMDKTDLIDFATRYAAAWSGQDPVAFAAFYAENGSLRINDGEPSVGRGAVEETAREFFTNFPDMVVRLVELREDGDYVEFHWHWTGTNLGPGGTGNAVDLRGYERWTLDSSGLILESLGHMDEVEYERQLNSGSTPE